KKRAVRIAREHALDERFALEEIFDGRRALVREQEHVAPRAETNARPHRHDLELAAHRSRRVVRPGMTAKGGMPVTKATARGTRTRDRKIRRATQHRFRRRTTRSRIAPTRPRRRIGSLRPHIPTLLRCTPGSEARIAPSRRRDDTSRSVRRPRGSRYER